MCSTRPLPTFLPSRKNATRYSCSPLTAPHITANQLMCPCSLTVPECLAAAAAPQPPTTTLHLNIPSTHLHPPPSPPSPPSQPPPAIPAPVPHQTSSPSFSPKGRITDELAELCRSDQVRSDTIRTAACDSLCHSACVLCMLVRAVWLRSCVLCVCACAVGPGTIRTLTKLCRTAPLAANGASPVGAGHKARCVARGGDGLEGDSYPCPALSVNT